jgi:hypothetical protein
MVSGRKKQESFIAAVNPNKIRAVKALVQERENTGDKIIIFSDDIFALEVRCRLPGAAFYIGHVLRK